MLTKDIRILVVDDLSTMREIIRDLLSELGYAHSAEAVDGAAAFSKLSSDEFDFLITDWSMPGMNGLELLRAVRSHSDLCELPVLMVTAEAKRDQIVEAAEAGVSGYIVKPFSAATLGEKIEHIMQSGTIKAAN